MAGNPLGAAAPASPSVGIARPEYPVPSSTRTRRLQGVCLAGDLLLSVYSSRQVGASHSVSLTLCDGAIERTVRLSEKQASELAQALKKARDAASNDQSRKD